MIAYPVITKKTTNTISGRYDDEQFNDLFEPTFTIPDDYNYQAYIVTAEFVARPDLLSKNIYGTVNYADVLCKLNGISNPFELNEGTVIIAPDVSDLAKFYKSPLNEVASEKAITKEGIKATKSLQKKKNETRQANASVIGDSNFKIDKNNKIIIY